MGERGVIDVAERLQLRGMVLTRCAAIPLCNFANGSFASILACPQHVRLRCNLGNAGYPVLPVEGIGLDVAQAPKGEPRIMV
jgi:hypothetical protein